MILYLSALYGRAYTLYYINFTPLYVVVFHSKILYDTLLYCTNFFSSKGAALQYLSGFTCVYLYFHCCLGNLCDTFKTPSWSCLFQNLDNVVFAK